MKVIFRFYFLGARAGHSGLRYAAVFLAIKKASPKRTTPFMSLAQYSAGISFSIQTKPFASLAQVFGIFEVSFFLSRYQQLRFSFFLIA